MSKQTKLKTFRVITDYFGTPTATIIRAVSSNWGRIRCWDSAHCAGYYLEWGTLKVSRAPEYEGVNLIEDKPYPEDWVKSQPQ